MTGCCFTGSDVAVECNGICLGDDCCFGCAIAAFTGVAVRLKDSIMPGGAFASPILHKTHDIIDRAYHKLLTDRSALLLA